MTPATLAAGEWETRFPRTLEERVATFGAAEAYGWFVLGALLLIMGVFGVVTFVIALREARGRRRLDALDASQDHHEGHACAEPETKRTRSEGDPTW